MKKYTSIEEFLKDYESAPGCFNMLTPIQSIQEIGSIFRPVINLYFISTDLEDSQIYVQKNAKDPEGNDYKERRYSISKRGLFLLASAADCHFLESRTTYNAETNQYTCVASMKMHDMSGGWRIITASKSVDRIKALRSGKTMQDPEAAQKAESGAQNRCIREGLNIKGHYSVEQLQKPFVAVYPVLNAADADVKQALIAGAVISNNMLYGGSKMLAITGQTMNLGTGEMAADNEPDEQPGTMPWQNGG